MEAWIHRRIQRNIRGESVRQKALLESSPRSRKTEASASMPNVEEDSVGLGVPNYLQQISVLVEDAVGPATEAVGDHIASPAISEDLREWFCGIQGMKHHGDFRSIADLPSEPKCRH